MVFTNNKRERIGKFVCAVSLYVAETPKASIIDQEPPLTIIPFGIVAYGFVGQPFSKQLYISTNTEPAIESDNVVKQVLNTRHFLKTD